MLKGDKRFALALWAIGGKSIVISLAFHHGHLKSLNLNQFIFRQHPLHLHKNKPKPYNTLFSIIKPKHQNQQALLNYIQLTKNTYNLNSLYTKKIAKLKEIESKQIASTISISNFYTHVYHHKHGCIEKCITKFKIKPIQKSGAERSRSGRLMEMLKSEEVVSDGSRRSGWRKMEWKWEEMWREGEEWWRVTRTLN